jgi:hypothetical protein
MKLSNTLIRGREYILDRLAGTPQILNPPQPNGNESEPDDIASSLRQTLQDLKAAAIDESGLRIDYATLRASPAYVERQVRLLSQLHSFNPHHLRTANARRAFWINLYNTLVIDAVISLNVEGSVTDGFFGLVAFFRGAAYKIGGQRVSLDDIEHGILRGNRGHPLLLGPHFASDDPRLEWMLPLDPRIHFALNCGARSCPPIRSYEPEKLDAQLDLATRSFLDTTVAIRPGEVSLSQLFRWYRADFGGRGGVRGFLLEYLNDDRRRELLSMGKGALRFRYAPYDWGLNALRSASR